MQNCRTPFFAKLSHRKISKFWGLFAAVKLDLNISPWGYEVIKWAYMCTPSLIKYIIIQPFRYTKRNIFKQTIWTTTQNDLRIRSAESWQKLTEIAQHLSYQHRPGYDEILQHLLTRKIDKVKIIISWKICPKITPNETSCCTDHVRIYINVK